MRDELVRLLEPPADTWAALLSPDEIVRGYGTRLPADYLWLMETYGPGEIARYLQIVPPVPADEVGKLSGVLPSGAYQEEGVEGLYPEYLVPGGLFLWGGTPDGDATFWATSGEPDEWPVVVRRRHPGPDEPAWTRYECGIVEFLVRTFQGRLQRNPFSGTDLWRNESANFVRD